MSNSEAVHAAYDRNAPVAAAALLGTLGRTSGERAGYVDHMCFECGGEYAAMQGALIVVQTCASCGGTGRIADADLSAAVTRFNRRVESGDHDG